MDEYTKEFYKLLTRVDLAESEDQLVSRYIGGLRQHIQDSLNPFDLVNMSEAHQRALHLEKTLARGPLRLFGRGGSGSNTRSNGLFMARSATQPSTQNMGPSTRLPNRAVTTSGPKCFRCGEPGHKIEN